MTSVEVCAAVVRRGDRVLLATRPGGSHLAGKWEFPGGKVAEGETLEECIRRELLEELGLGILRAEHLGTVEHTYPGKHVVLHFLECLVPADAEPVCRLAQKAEWFPADCLAALDLAPADRIFVERFLRP
ncbi:MAG: NUDIX domain-containing protein [Lentisphaeria bacterium]|nr:NUDIX domain-containing protein [Lentisphaeria bacterium]